MIKGLVQLFIFQALGELLSKFQIPISVHARARAGLGFITGLPDPTRPPARFH
jgi:hypothetical protein